MLFDRNFKSFDNDMIDMKNAQLDVNNMEIDVNNFNSFNQQGMSSGGVSSFNQETQSGCQMSPIVESPVEKCVHRQIMHEVPHV